jgi:hypothetical protein
MYNQPEFLELVAPGKGFYAAVPNDMGHIAWFPFTGQNLLLKWRVFQVPFCQRFEPFSIEGKPDFTQWKNWFSFLQKNTIQLHWPFEADEATVQNSQINCQMKTNQFLSLRFKADFLIGQWKQGRKSALKKSEPLTVAKPDAATFRKHLDQITGNTDSKGWVPSDKEKVAILRISDSVFYAGNIKRFAVMDGDEVLCLVLLIDWKGRFHYLFSVSSSEGFSKDALTRFFFDFIHQNAEKEAIFDFEGSSLPGVNAFFKSLGAEEEKYWLVSG